MKAEKIENHAPRLRRAETLSAEFITLKTPGQTVQGKYLREYVKKWEEVDGITGEMVEKQATVLVFATPDGENVQLWEDGGLRSQAESIKTGELIEIEFTGQKKLRSGFNCNTYKVYRLAAM